MNYRDVMPIKWYILEQGNWSFIRYKLEAFGAEKCHVTNSSKKKRVFHNGVPYSNQILRGYILHKLSDFVLVPKLDTIGMSILENGASSLLTQSQIQELHGQTFVFPNTFVAIQQWPMPWGSKAYVPLDQISTYHLLDHEASKGNETAQFELDQMKRQHSKYFHAADRKICTLLYKNIRLNDCTDVQGHNVVFYSEPPKDYTCHGCQRRGHHYQDACFLFTPIKVSDDEETSQEITESTKAIFQQWGPQKYQPQINK